MWVIFTRDKLVHFFSLLSATAVASLTEGEGAQFVSLSHSRKNVNFKKKINENIGFSDTELLRKQNSNPLLSSSYSQVLKLKSASFNKSEFEKEREKPQLWDSAGCADEETISFVGKYKVNLFFVFSRRDSDFWGACFRAPKIAGEPCGDFNFLIPIKFVFTIKFDMIHFCCQSQKGHFWDFREGAGWFERDVRLRPGSWSAGSSKQSPSRRTADCWRSTETLLVVFGKIIVTFSIWRETQIRKSKFGIFGIFLAPDGKFYQHSKIEILNFHPNATNFVFVFSKLLFAGAGADSVARLPGNLQRDPQLQQCLHHRRHSVRKQNSKKVKANKVQTEMN